MRSVQKGVTLIETMMALSVLAIAIMSLLTLIPATSRLISDANEYEIARHAADAMITKIRVAGLDAVGSYDGAAFEVPGLNTIADEAECGSVTVADGPDGEGGAKEVRVVVLWRGMDKLNKQIEVVTLIGH
jgi:prepilin-type N-terminal cleavage/methylation domain-containing protein